MPAFGWTDKEIQVGPALHTHHIPGPGESRQALARSLARSLACLLGHLDIPSRPLALVLTRSLLALRLGPHTRHIPTTIYIFFFVSPPALPLFT